MFKIITTSQSLIEENKSDKIIHNTYKIFNLTYWKNTTQEIWIRGEKSTKSYFVFGFLLYATTIFPCNSK